MTLALSPSVPLPRHRASRRPSLFDSLKSVCPPLRSAQPAPQTVLHQNPLDGGALDLRIEDGVLHRARHREAKIILVGDTDESLGSLCELLRSDGYSRLRCATEAYAAVNLARSWKPDLVILDLARPHRAGLEMLSKMAQAADDGLFLPILMLSGDASDKVRLRALSLGACDFLLRPFNPSEVQLRVRNLLEARWCQLELSERNGWLEAKLRERTLEIERLQSELKAAQAEMIVRLALAAEMHDPETGHHTRRVGLSASLLAQSVGLHEREVQMIQLAAPLHDIGKIAIPDELLLKPGKLSPEEWDEMKAHCRIGAQVLACGQADLVQVAQRIALFHHEHWDGSGYPMGLCEEQIPLEARILAVADVFDALTHERPYKHAWPIDEALHEIETQSARHFDPQIVAAFRELPHEELV